MTYSDLYPADYHLSFRGIMLLTHSRHRNMVESLIDGISCIVIGTPASLNCFSPIDE